MLVVNAKEVREKFSSILDEVEKGEDIVITRRGKKLIITDFGESIIKSVTKRIKIEFY